MHAQFPVNSSFIFGIQSLFNLDVSNEILCFLFLIILGHVITQGKWSPQIAQDYATIYAVIYLPAYKDVINQSST